MGHQERNAFGLTDRDMRTFQDIFKNYPSVATVLIFGSRAKGTHKFGSDIDLAVMNDGVEETDIDRLKRDFEESSLPYTVDVTHYPRLKHPELKGHIDRVGVPFYQKQ